MDEEFINQTLKQKRCDYSGATSKVNPANVKG